MASRIDTLISKCRSWDEFVELVNSLPKSKNKEKGDLFERLTQVYLQTQPTYRSKLKNVYLLSDKTIPEQLRTKLNLPDNDEGIDLVCETYSGEYWSVQCKYKSDQSSALTYKELSTFNSLSFNACKGISLGLVAHTSTKPVKKSHLMPMVNEIGLEKWLEISDADWKQIISICRSNRLKPPKKRSPRKHQKAAIADAHNHFITKKQKRGKLIMPCGTGKSLTAYWIAQALEAKTIVVAVPSLALVRQSLADWTAEYLAEDVTPEWLAVCSDHSVGSMGDADSTVATAYEMGIPTNPTDEELDNFLKKRSKAPKVVFTTYQSAEKLCDASRRNNKTFDLLIADEAHKTVGRKSKSFATLLFDENIKVKRRLFMTATERVYNASRDDVVSMDDPVIYGSTCHQLSFKEAIKQKIICDYKIVTIAVSDAEINTLIQEKAELSVSAGNKTIETDAQSLAAGLAMQKAFEKYGIKHAITFHSSITRAKSFKHQQEDLPNNVHISHSHISSELSAGQRAKLLKGFSEEERSLVTNARCLTEGVDIKAIDCVAFVDPKQSTIDIVQAAGRAMRQSKETGKEYGYIIVPVQVSKGSKLEDFKKSSSYGQVVKIITALSTQDERIAEQLRVKATNKRKVRKEILQNDFSNECGFGVTYEEIASTLEAVMWERIGPANWRTYYDARQHVQKLGLTTQKEWKVYSKSEERPRDIPSSPERVYRNSGWHSLGDWLGTYSVANKNKGFLPFKDAKKYVLKLGILSEGQWREFAESDARPSNIPSNPQRSYVGKGWAGWSNFLRDEEKPALLEIEQSQQIVRNLSIQTAKQFKQRWKTELAPVGVPSDPPRVYKENGWESWGAFLDNGVKRAKKSEILSFNIARKNARKLNIDGARQWKQKFKEGLIPEGLPVAPEYSYKDNGWAGWADWLSNKTDFVDYETAKKHIKKLNIKTHLKWVAFDKNKLPEGVPKAPNAVYQRDGSWVSWPDFLSSDSSDWQFVDFDTARQFAASLDLKSWNDWKRWCSNNKKPQNIPYKPNLKYKNMGWVSWPHFLGKED